MKSFTYEWPNEFDGIYLLHVQIDLAKGCTQNVTIIRTFKDKTKKEQNSVFLGNSNRFIVSRSHINEEKVEILYPPAAKLKVYEIDDRAYYPTESLFDE